MSQERATRPERLGDLIATAWRLFRLAPRSAAVLWALGVAAAFVLQRGATDRILGLGSRDLGGQRLAEVVAAIVLGWGADCVLKALWARLAWQALHGQATGLGELWRRLRGAWAGVGLLVAYATLTAGALGWPHLVRIAADLQHPTKVAVATALFSLGAAWLGLGSALGVPAAAVDHLGGAASWRASWRMTRGRLWKVGLLLPLPALLGLVVGRRVGVAAGDQAHAETVATLVGAAAEASLAGLPGTLFFAWRAPRT